MLEGTFLGYSNASNAYLVADADGKLSLEEMQALQELRRKKQETRQTESFLHLHVGIDASDLPADLESHHVAVKSWDDIRSEQNVVIVSIPSLLDPTLAPKGKHNIHAYLAGNESYDVWEGLKRGDQKYKDLKVERSQRLWEVLEQIIPDVRKRVETSSVGTPLTIDRFCRRDRGNYGPAIKGKQTFFPGPHHLQIEGLVHCGDSTNPGIGLPSAAASGMAAAHAIAPIWKQWQSLEDLARFRKEGRNPRYTTFEPGEVIKHIKPNLMQAFA